MRKLDQNIWLYELPDEPAISSRVVVRLSSGGLWIHSPPALSKQLASEVRKLGRVEAIIAPNNAHHRFVTHWCNEFPDAKPYVARGVPAKNPERKHSAFIAEVAAALWAADFDFTVMKGAPLLGECVFLHRTSRTLILSDLVQHYPPAASVATKIFLGPMGWKGIRPAPPLRFDFVVHDRAALTRFIDDLEEWEFDRITVTHGKCLERDAKEIFAQICERITTQRGSTFHGFIMRRLLNQLNDGGLPKPIAENA